MAETNQFSGNEIDVTQNLVVIWLDEHIHIPSYRLPMKDNLYKLVKNIKTFEKTDDFIKYMLNDNHEQQQIFLIITDSLWKSISSSFHQFSSMIKKTYVTDSSSSYFEGSFNTVRCCDTRQLLEALKKQVDQLSNELHKNFPLRAQGEKRAQTFECNYNQNIFQDYVIVWLSEQIDDIQTEVNDRLLSIVDSASFYGDADQCFDYITDLHNNEKVYFIVSDELVLNVLPILHGLSQIENIYIVTDEPFEIIARAEGLHVSFCSSTDDILYRLKKRLKRDVIQSIQISIYNPYKNEKSYQLGVHNIAFFLQLFMDTTLELPDKYYTNAKDEMLNECRSYYKNNHIVMNNIKDFEQNYQSSVAITWYSKDSFIYRLVNKALRTQNLRLIYKFRFIIKDIHNQLKLAHNQQPTTYTNAMTVYRGQLLKPSELNTLIENVHGNLQINTFLSTTCDEALALVYAGNGTESPFLESVLFEIEIPSTTKKVFANIANFSEFENENEYLFSCCTTFAINSYTKKDNIWYVHLTLNDYYISNELFTNYRLLLTVDQVSPTYWTLSSILFHLGDSEKRRHHYRMTFNRLPIKHPDFLHEYFLHGLQYKSYELAFEFCENGFQEKLSCSSRLDHDTLFRYYSEMGFVCMGKQEYTLAIQYYEKALDIFPQIDQSLVTSNDLSWLYVWIGTVYHKMGNYKEMMNYYNKGLEIQKQLLQNNHIELISFHNDMASGYIEQSNETLAQIHTIEALEKLFQSSSCIKGHYSFERTMSNIIRIKKKFGTLIQFDHKCVRQLCSICHEYEKIQNNDEFLHENSPTVRVYHSEADEYGCRRPQLSTGTTMNIFVDPNVQIFVNPDSNIYSGDKRIQNPSDCSQQ